ncbi:hypothetical protein PJ912_09310 [Pectobacterium colocasium]|uniref:Uncharacterized protein n=2 Tax=Pectobacterium TaxID=122277 RepID=A0A9X8JFZ3_9GAMM|nr:MULTISPECIES: hypothetical protein [Pectobacteriaceae]QWT42200.1 hypothetical protein KNV89_06850 [Dickeya dadantii]RYC41249.1 hypothetical protein DEH81_14840 [Pectobacterium zantedeschiae]RYC41485.1 hypothetical protein CLR69_15225 [Pectobacterium zantedeschiae]RYC46693.1 hypothetical protein CTN06_10220 [Pectobacterium zantedeschiae]
MKPDPRKKSRSTKIIPLILLSLVLAAGGIGFLYVFSLAKQIDEDIEQRLGNGMWDMPAQVYSKS